MDRYGKVTFYLNELYCQVELIMGNKKKYYKFNKKDSLKFFKELVKEKDLFYINKNKNKNTIILSKDYQLKAIFDIIKKNRLVPKKTIHRARKDFLTKVAAVVTAISISSSGLLMLKNTQKRDQSVNISKPKVISIDEMSHAFDMYSDTERLEALKARIEALVNNVEKVEEEEKVRVTDDTSLEVMDEDGIIEEKTADEKNDEVFSISETVNNDFDLNGININYYDYEMFNEGMDKYYPYFEKYGKMYGIDPYLIAMIACQESGGNHKKEVNNNTAVGLCQLEKEWNVVDVLEIPEDEFVAEKANDYLKEKTTKVYNYETNSYDYLVGATEYSVNTFNYFDVDIDSKYTVLNLKNVEDNIRMCAGILAHNLKELDGNLFATLISYNQGLPEVKKYIREYAEELGISESDAINRTNWVKLIPDYYGDSNYHNNVLKFAIAGNREIHCITGTNNIKECNLTISGDYIPKNRSRYL